MLENFAMLIPKFGLHYLNGCLISNATGNEFVAFEMWAHKEIIQLQANEVKIDLWINNDVNGMGITAKTLQEWFNDWKNPSMKTYGFKTCKIKLK